MASVYVDSVAALASSGSQLISINVDIVGLQPALASRPPVPSGGSKLPPQVVLVCSCNLSEDMDEDSKLDHLTRLAFWPGQPFAAPLRRAQPGDVFLLHDAKCSLYEGSPELSMTAASVAVKLSAAEAVMDYPALSALISRARKRSWLTALS